MLCEFSEKNCAFKIKFLQEMEIHQFFVTLNVNKYGTQFQTSIVRQSKLSVNQSKYTESSQHSNGKTFVYP